MAALLVVNMTNKATTSEVSPSVANVFYNKGNVSHFNKGRNVDHVLMAACWGWGPYLNNDKRSFFSECDGDGYVNAKTCDERHPDPYFWNEGWSWLGYKARTGPESAANRRPGPWAVEGTSA